MFGADWRPDERPPLGEATAAFDYLQLLRLRADALREAADVDVGIIWAHTPGWNRWEDSMPAGPVTLQALATQDACPEQVCVGEMTGEDLLRQRSRPAAWSLLADKRQPGYVAGKTLAVSDIDPEKTYRVAMGYHGIPHVWNQSQRNAPAFQLDHPGGVPGQQEQLDAHSGPHPDTAAGRAKPSPSTSASIRRSRRAPRASA